MWGLARGDDGTWPFAELLDTDLLITGSGEDETSNLYITSCNCTYGSSRPSENQPGALWRMVAADQVPQGAETAPLGSSLEGHGD